MLLSITAKEFDMAGAVLLDVPDPDNGELSRRSNRIATLDGGAAVNDFGFSDADRTITLTWTATATEDETLQRLQRYHDRIIVSVKAGVFESIISSYATRNGRATLIVLPVVRMNE